MGIAMLKLVTHSQKRNRISMKFTFLFFGKGRVLYHSSQALPYMNNMLLKGYIERGIVRLKDITTYLKKNKVKPHSEGERGWMDG